MNNLEYKDQFDLIVDNLLLNFPELKENYNTEMEWWGDEHPGLHNLLGNIFVPFVISQLYNFQDQDKIGVIFSFIEELVTNDDKYISNVGEVTVCEGIVFDGPESFNKALLFALPESKKCLMELYKDFYIDKKDEL